MKKANLELGNKCFNTNTNQVYECPKNLLLCLITISNVLKFSMQFENPDYDNPFNNTGNIYKNDVFVVQAYSWNDEVNQPYNFKYKDIEVSWYKYLGRDTTVNKKVTPTQCNKLLTDCINSILDNLKIS